MSQKISWVKSVFINRGWERHWAGSWRGCYSFLRLNEWMNELHCHMKETLNWERLRHGRSTWDHIYRLLTSAIMDFVHVLFNASSSLTRNGNEIINKTLNQHYWVRHQISKTFVIRSLLLFFSISVVQVPSYLKCCTRPIKRRFWIWGSPAYKPGGARSLWLNVGLGLGLLLVNFNDIQVGYVSVG